MRRLSWEDTDGCFNLFVFVDFSKKKEEEEEKSTEKKKEEKKKKPFSTLDVFVDEDDNHGEYCALRRRIKAEMTIKEVER